MDETDKKRRRMNTEGESVNRDHDKEKTDGAVPTDNRPPKELDTSDSSNLSDIANLNTDDFKIVRTQLTFVDKSECIKCLFECAWRGVQITAPRGFGKSTFMNMLAEFLMITVDEDAKPISNPESSDNYKMFMNLKLGQNHPNFVKKHCGQYPVISMSLKDVEGTTPTDVLNTLKTAICETFREHRYLLEEAPDGAIRGFKNKKIEDFELFLKFYEPNRLPELLEWHVTHSLYFLSEILYTHFNKKVVILIDEADPPIMKAITHSIEDETLKYIMRLLMRMLSEGLQCNKFLERSLVSSCVLFSGNYWELNNQYHARFLQTNDFSETYGFTEQEVRDLLDNAAFRAVKDLDGVKKWYNGYQTLTKKEASIYNNWSVISYLKNSIAENKKMFDSYWAQSGLLNILKRMLVNDEIQSRINKLIKGESISIVIADLTVENILELKKAISYPQHELNYEQVDFFMQLLWDQGLLNAIKSNRYIATLKIPNFEIKKEIQKLLNAF